MKALTFKRYGKSPEIGFADVPQPTLKANELLVQVHAASVNPIDNMIPTGLFKAVLPFQLPATLGSDLAGVVTEVGTRVTCFKPGDAVFASIFDLGTDEVVDYKKQEFERVLRGYDTVLGTVRGDAIEKSIGILKAGSKIVSIVGPLDAAFARARRLNFVLAFVFGLMSRKIIRLARKRQVDYSFLFVRPDGDQLAE